MRAMSILAELSESRKGKNKITPSPAIKKLIKMPAFHLLEDCWIVRAAIGWPQWGQLAALGETSF